MMSIYPKYSTHKITTATHTRNRLESGKNDIGLYDTLPIASDILWYQLISHS
jgi:hypothetical protein